LERLALGNPALVLRYINNGQIIFQTTGNGDLKTTMLNIYGREIASKTATVDATANEMHLHGLIGKPETARGNRKHGSFFINGRYIESKLISRAIESAMKTMLPSGKFPVYALNLSMPPDTLDVNVHPTKMDVRFADEEGVFAFVEDAVRDALEEHNLIPRIQKRIPAEYAEPQPEPEQISLPSEKFPPSEKKYFVKEYLPSEEKKFSISENISLREEGNYREEIREEKKREEKNFKEKICEEKSEPKKFFENYQIIGIIFQTYWIVTQNDSMYLIDRHAAHERILYEDFLRKAQEEKIHAQTLITPLPLRLTPREKQILHDNKEIFARFGFEISNEKEEILSVPFLMKGPLSSSFFTELLDKIDEAGFAKNSPYTHKTEIIAMAACKAAIKAGDTQNESEARDLISRLLELNNPFTCPHGRPTIIEMPKSEIERRFKR